MSMFNQIVKQLLPLEQGGVIVDKMSTEDILLFAQHTIDYDIATMTCRPLQSKRSVESVVNNIMSFSNNDNNCLLGIYIIRASNERFLVGRITIFDYNSRNRSAEFGYCLIEKYRNHGYMTQALQLLCCEIIGNDKVLNKLYAQTLCTNYASTHLLDKLNFHLDGVLRQHHEVDGELFDDYIYSLLASDMVDSR